LEKKCVYTVFNCSVEKTHLEIVISDESLKRKKSLIAALPLHLAKEAVAEITKSDYFIAYTESEARALLSCMGVVCHKTSIISAESLAAKVFGKKIPISQLEQIPALRKRTEHIRWRGERLFYVKTDTLLALLQIYREAAALSFDDDDDDASKTSAMKIKEMK